MNFFQAFFTKGTMMERKPLRLIFGLVGLIVLFNQAVYAKENLPILFKKVAPSVVVIFAYDAQGKTMGIGSGFFVNNKAEVITNGHVIEGAYRAQVKTAWGKIYDVQKIMAEDRDADLVRFSTNVPVREVRPIILSNSVPETGEKVLVIGSPQGLERTLSEGIVSAVREIPTIGKVLQISAPISPGSSGSPVLNMKGEVVGVATLQLVEGQNLNFAMPCKRVRDLAAVKDLPMGKWQETKKSPGDDEFYQAVMLLSAGSYQKA